MVTRRWWGNKFCNRTCKGAYLRDLALDRDTIRLSKQLIDELTLSGHDRGRADEVLGFLEKRLGGVRVAKLKMLLQGV
jgi:hypothetical protein